MANGDDYAYSFHFGFGFFRWNFVCVCVCLKCLLFAICYTTIRQFWFGTVFQPAERELNSIAKKSIIYLVTVNQFAMTCKEFCECNRNIMMLNRASTNVYKMKNFYFLWKPVLIERMSAHCTAHIRPNQTKPKLK